MRLRNITGAGEAIANSPFVEQDPRQRRGSWKACFHNNHPIRMEVGMGKGRFLMQMAALHPDANYIGIERYTSVLLRAIQKMDGQERRPENLRFICVDARELPELFAPGEVNRIYLNFSDPWPKERHAKRRLVSRQFLQRFDQVLEPDGRLEFKTDNSGLFDFALEELEPAGWKLEAVTRDLHHDDVLGAGNVMTEYEEKFSAQGNPIHKYIIYR